MQLLHHQSKFSPKESPIILICDHLNNTANIGGIFRLCDAFGVEKLYLVGLKTPLSNKTKKASRSTLKTVNYTVLDSATDLISSLRLESYAILGLEITKNSREISELQNSDINKIAWIIGNEIDGISNELLNLCDQIYHIEMNGLNSSMNVVMATSIALFCTRKAIKKP